MDQPLDLASFAAPAAEPAEAASHEPRIESESIVERGLHGLRNRSPFDKPFGDEGEEPVDLGPPPFAAPEIEEAAEQPLPFAAPAEIAERQTFQAPEAPAAEPAPVFAAAAQAPEAILPTDPKAEIADLGMVQLAERLAASLQRRLARPAASSALVAGLKSDFGIETAAGEAAEDIAPASAIFGQSAFEPVAPEAAPPPPVIPEALRPLPLAMDGFDDEDDDEDSHLPSLSLPLGDFSPPAAAEQDEDEPEDIGEAEENYSSLLAINHSFRSPAEFVRIDEPEPEDGEIEPAVVFPAEAPAAAVEPEPAAQLSEARPFDAPSIASPGAHKADPEETDRALRSALATLQRMSGAA